MGQSTTARMRDTSLLRARCKPASVSPISYNRQHIHLAFSEQDARSSVTATDVTRILKSASARSHNDLSPTLDRTLAILERLQGLDNVERRLAEGQQSSRAALEESQNRPLTCVGLLLTSSMLLWDFPLEIHSGCSSHTATGGYLYSRSCLIKLEAFHTTDLGPVRIPIIL